MAALVRTMMTVLEMPVEVLEEVLLLFVRGIIKRPGVVEISQRER
jgi:hypothetical protein